MKISDYYENSKKIKEKTFKKDISKKRIYFKKNFINKCLIRQNKIIT